MQSDRGEDHGVRDTTAASKVTRIVDTLLCSNAHRHGSSKPRGGSRLQIHPRCSAVIVRIQTRERSISAGGSHGLAPSCALATGIMTQPLVPHRVMRHAVWRKRPCSMPRTLSLAPGSVDWVDSRSMVARSYAPLPHGHAVCGNRTPRNQQCRLHAVHVNHRFTALARTTAWPLRTHRTVGVRESASRTAGTCSSRWASP